MISSFFLAFFALSIVGFSNVCAHFLVKNALKKQNVPLASTAFVSVFLAGTLMTLWHTESLPFLATKSILIFLLSISLFTDLYTLLLADIVTIYPIPFIITAAFFDLLPISFLESIVGFLFAYCLLLLIDIIVLKYTKQQGIGEGDKGLLALIGSATGIQGAWFSLMIGSLIGSCIGICMYLFGYSLKKYHFPFGTFIVIGTMFYLLFEKIIVSFF